MGRAATALRTQGASGRRSFPYDFGFIPNTRGEDGDELDVLVLMDEPAFTGCLVRSRMLDVIEAEQTEKGKANRNDRLIAVASKSRAFGPEIPSPT